MAVKYYHVIGFVQNQNVPSYLGRTSDLTFKTEPDKSVDTDDGMTTVGSEKLSCSFNLLEPVINPGVLEKVWLVPSVSGVSNAEILEIRVATEDYKIEQKSGEFGKTAVSIVMRYPTDTPSPWGYLSDEYFFDNVIILGRLSGNVEEEERIIVKQNNLEVGSYEIVPEVVQGTYAIVNVPSQVPTTLHYKTTQIKSFTQDEFVGVLFFEIVL